MSDKIRKNKSDLGPDFVAPDGGYGWIICIAVGFSFMFGFILLQQFGLICRERLFALGMDSSQITTLINVNTALSSCTGIFNGPIFRRFSYRQVAITASAFTSLGVICTSFANSFLTYLITFSFLYGISVGINMSASSLVLYTYFKKRRTRVSGMAFAITGLGYTVMPYVVNILRECYSSQDCILLIGGITMNTIACACLYQPVKWHVKEPKPDVELQQLVVDGKLSEKCDNCKNSQIVSDGREGSENAEKNENMICECPNEVKSAQKDDKKSIVETTIDDQLNHSLISKIVIFFDLDLLKDFTYVNLLVGLTAANFVETNFALLVPFILGDFDFSKANIAVAMSVMGITDLLGRFLIPFATEKIGWQNKTFFVIGILGLALGRVFYAHIRMHELILAASAWIGLSKSFRTIFMGLVIPSHVPLNRLPAACGFYQLFLGVFSIIFGFILGWTRDKTNYTVALHTLNIATFWTVCTWGIEELFHYRKKRNVNNINQQNSEL